MSEGVGSVTCANVAIENDKNFNFERKWQNFWFYEIKLQKPFSDVPNPFDMMPRDLYLVSHDIVTRVYLLSMKISLDVRIWLSSSRPVAGFEKNLNESRLQKP